MAAAFKAINARIRSNPYTDYLCSTHFWGPASNFGIPIAAVMDTQKSPEIISGQMTSALLVYSSVFMRYALAVSPKNYLLFGCHVVNFSGQSVQMYRYWNYHYGSGAATEKAAKDTVSEVKSEAQGLASEAKGKASELVKKVEEKVGK